MLLYSVTVGHLDDYCQELLGSYSLQLSEHTVGLLSIDINIMQYDSKQIVIACSHQGQTYCSSMAGSVLQLVSPQDCGSMIKLKNSQTLLETDPCICLQQMQEPLTPNDQGVVWTYVWQLLQVEISAISA